MIAALGNRMGKAPNFEDVVALYRLLNNDVDKSIDKLNSAAPEDKEFYARSYIRAYASWIEGSVWVHKQMISRAEFNWYRDLPLESQLYLFEKDWRISDSGLPKSSRRKIGAKENLKSFFVVMSQLFEGFKVDLGGSGWRNILYFYQVRDGLMHPIAGSDLSLANIDLNKCDKGRIWLKNQFKKLAEEITVNINA